MDALAPRLRRVSGVESILLVVRYIIVAVYSGYVYYLASQAPAETELGQIEIFGADDPFRLGGLLVLAAIFLGHNLLVHFIASTGRRHWYLSSTYTVIHLVSGTLLVTLTGAEKSPFVVVYILILLGQVLYAPHFRRTFSVVLLSVVALTGAIFVRWLAVGVAPEILPLFINFLALYFCYQLIRSLASLLHTVELGLQNHAQELASSKATLRTILDAADGPIVVYDDNEFITETNPRACEFFQCDREALLGTRFRQYFFDDGTLPGKLATLKARGEYQGEVIAVLPEGAELNVVISVKSYIREGRRFFVALLHDVTEQKQLQEATRVANVELEIINRELQRVEALRNEFHSTISQRLRSPLSAILGYTDLLIDEELGELNAPQRKALQTCRRSVMRVFNLVDEAFEAGQPAGDRVPPQHSAESPREEMASRKE